MSVMHEIEYTDFERFYRDISPYGALNESLSGYIFRGQCSVSFELLPTLFRKDNLSIMKVWSATKFPQQHIIRTNLDQIFVEYVILKNFYMLANYRGLYVPYISNFLFENQDDVFSDIIKDKNEVFPECLAELAVLAQHYGVPTRMLDWSFDMNVALYFATQGACKEIYDNKKTDDFFELWALDYNFFKDFINSDFGLKFIVPSYHYNANLCAQKGILTYFISKSHLKDLINNIPLDKMICDFFKKDRRKSLIYRIKISYTCAKETFKMLNKIGYSASSIFPGYAGIAQEMDEKKYIYQL